MSSSRFFVANLPPNTTEKNLRDIFQDYGSVERIELKTKENPVDLGSIKVIAFVTLQINPDEVSHCVETLNWQKVKGAKIKVSLAKESFLDRLKREREEAETGKSDIIQNNEVHTAPSLPHSKENTRKTFTEEELIRMDEDDDIAPELMISKKRAATSLHNGKIVIQNYDTAPLHIIETQKKKKKSATQLPDKANAAEQKRKQSVNKMNNQYKQNKSFIQQALAGLDSAKSKKIKFSDAEDDADDVAMQPKTKKAKTQLFDDDEAYEDAGNDLSLKPELFGKKGVKLLQLQSKQSLDPRFKIDAKFVDDDDDNEDDNVEHDEQTDAHNDTSQATNERNWQMGILEQVVGTKLSTADDAQKAAQKKRMLRFDPAKQEHQKLLRTTAKESTATDESMLKQKKQGKLQEPTTAQSDNSTTAPEVSKEVFYVVTDTLTQSLKTRGDGFSLLNMFGSEKTHEQLEQRNNELKKVTDAKILVNKLDRNAMNPFSYDSSTDEEIDNATTMTANCVEDTKATQKNTKQQAKLVTESFFIPHNDARLKEGAKFFKFDKQNVAPEDYEEVRNRLKMLIKTKINKTKKNLITQGGGSKRIVGHKGRIRGHH